MPNPVTEYTAARCPRCGSTLITDDEKVWCTYVGGQSVGKYAISFFPSCAFGIDSPVTVAEMEAMAGRG